MRLIHRTVRHPTLQHLPGDVREHVEKTMTQAARQQVLTDAFPHVHTTQDAGDFHAELGVLTPYEFNRAQLLARDVIAADQGAESAAVQLARLVLSLPDDTLPGWNGVGVRPVTHREDGLVTFALAPFEIEPAGPQGWRTRGEVVVRPPDGVTRLTDVAVILPSGQTVRPGTCRARSVGAQFMVTAEGTL